MASTNPKKQLSDDDMYVALMDKYKRLRVKDGPKANRYLDAALKLREKGGVSDDSYLGGAYL